VSALGIAKIARGEARGRLTRPAAQRISLEEAGLLVGRALQEGGLAQLVGIDLLRILLDHVDLHLDVELLDRLPLLGLHQLEIGDESARDAIGQPARLLDVPDDLVQW